MTLLEEIKTDEMDCFEFKRKVSQRDKRYLEMVFGNVRNPGGHGGNPVANAVVRDASLGIGILNCLCGDAKMAAAKMAQGVHVSSHTIERPWARLETSGCIVRMG